MDNQGQVNLFMVFLGVVTILLCAFVGMLSSPAYLGILGGVALIWVAFPQKRPAGNGTEPVDDMIDGTATSTGMNLKLD